MKKALCILTLSLLVLLCVHVFTINNCIAGDEDLPRVFLLGWVHSEKRL
jgi:hypothetical protein